MTCAHSDVRCLNEHEPIRKYECLQCQAVMMCLCDQQIGTKFLPHQLREGTELTTQQRIPVTVGFQPGICRECRGLPPEAHPAGESFGRTSKIKRYYWRELMFRGMEIYAELTGESDVLTMYDPPRAEMRAKADELALKEIKALHDSPRRKYTFSELSQQDVIDRYKVKVISLHAVHVRDPEKRKIQLVDSDGLVDAEEFVSRHFQRLGYSTMPLESRPFHALFGVFMWSLIGDLQDPRCRFVGFGDRRAYEARRPGIQVWTPLPEDFGTRGYAERRAAAIDRHLSGEVINPMDLPWLFDYWRAYSEELRQYLWAHRDEDVEAAGRLVDILPPDVSLSILRYLVGNYWGRYLGWPDLLIYKANGEYLFAEVKASGDKLSEDQKDWISGNHDVLQLPFVLVKIHNKRPTLMSSDSSGAK